MATKGRGEADAYTLKEANKVRRHIVSGKLVMSGKSCYSSSPVQEYTRLLRSLVKNGHLFQSS